MKTRQNEHPYDGCFENNGQMIWVRIIPDNKSVRIVQGIEKMSGFFDFFDNNGNNLGTIAFCENYDNLTPVCVSILETYYAKLHRAT